MLPDFLGGKIEIICELLAGWNGGKHRDFFSFEKLHIGFIREPAFIKMIQDDPQHFDLPFSKIVERQQSVIDGSQSGQRNNDDGQFHLLDETGYICVFIERHARAAHTFHQKPFALIFQLIKRGANLLPVDGFLF